MYIDYFYGFFLPYPLILKPETTCDSVLLNNYHFFLLKHVNFLFHHGNFQSWAQKVGALGTALPFSTLCASSCLPDRTPSRCGACPGEEVNLLLLYRLWSCSLLWTRCKPLQHSFPPSLFFVSPPLLYLYSSKPFFTIPCLYHSPPLPSHRHHYLSFPLAVASLQDDPVIPAYLYIYHLHQAGMICVTARILQEWRCTTCKVKVLKDTWLPLCSLLDYWARCHVVRRLK